MLYVVEIRRDREALSSIMASIREWLDRRGFEPDAFRCMTDEESVTCRLEFEIESEAIDCAYVFGAEARPMGNKPA
jgi:hypothetical protein